MSVSALHTAKAPAITAHLRRCHGCGSQLSRYNNEAHCGACLRSAWGSDPIRPLVPAHVWESAEVQLALRERDFGTLCLLVRRLGSLRQDDVATLTGLSQAFLSMLESGDRRLTNIDKIVLLLEGLDVPIELTGPILRGPKTPIANCQRFAEPERESA
ncbi:helix-turn-helix transcriptional regulator [Streptomyces sp. NPDC005407]|uniref:helix-turn-helix domain-containing protein n=1 Tax=Streptomyces sp. NPDC005407 TaxID=3155340 RepID=UPI0033BC2C9C